MNRALRPDQLAKLRRRIRRLLGGEMTFDVRTMSRPTRGIV
jgi:hypothetical protein